MRERVSQVVVLAAVASVAIAACGEPGTTMRSAPNTIVFAAAPSRDEFLPQLFAMKGDGTDVRQLTNDESLKTAIAISPDGGEIAYAFLPADRPPVEGQPAFTSISAIAIDGSDERLLCDACSRTFYSQVPGENAIDPAGAADYIVPDSLSWSPDGTRIVAPASRNGLLVVDADDGSTDVIDTDEPITAVAWSPDGHRVAASHTWFLSPNNALGEMAPPSGTVWSEDRIEEGPGGIHLIDVDTGAVEEVVSTDGLAHVHGWSPDGTAIAFTRLGGSGRHGEVAVYSFDEDQSWPVVPAERGSAPIGVGWSLDGSIAAMVDQYDEESQTAMDLWVASSDGSTADALPVCEFKKAFDGDNCAKATVAWSPDGTTVAYRAILHGTPTVSALILQDARDPSVTRIVKIDPATFDIGEGPCCLAWF